MAVEVSELQIPPQFANTLTKLTDEPRLDVALRLVLKDALEYRLGKVQKSLLAFRNKYQVAFPTFKKRWLTGQIPNHHSYPVEKDFWEWEGLVSRFTVLNQLKKWL